jgi:predicted ATPase
MIKSIKVKNFLSFENETFPIDKNLNILVGINGAGKSNFLKTFRLLKEGVAGVGLRKYVIDLLGGFDNIYFKNDKGNVDFIEIEYTFDAERIGEFGSLFTEDIVYTIELHKSPSVGNYYVSEKIKNLNGFTYLEFANGSGGLNELEDTKSNLKESRLVKYNDFVDSTELALSKVYDTDRYFALSTIRKAISDIMVYEYFDTMPKSLIRKPMLPTSEKRLLPDGTNLPQILNTIKINNKSSYLKIASMLNQVNSKFKGFDFNFLGGNIELMLEEDYINSSIHVTSISDGTLRYLCLLAILINPDRGSIICIDEPEVGLHPDMISNIGNAVIEASEKSTIIISTHSENLLNCFELENLRIFEKDDHNSSKVFVYNKSDFKGWYDEFSSGKMWRQGDLGGNRW